MYDFEEWVAYALGAGLKPKTIQYLRDEDFDSMAMTIRV